MAKKDEQTGVDERYLDEWILYGLDEIASYLTKHAKFDAWCLEHGQEGAAQDG